MPGAYSLEEAYRKIKQLIKEERWLEAHRACLEVLQFDPENLKIIHYKNKIEKKVKQINKVAIADDIKKLKPLWAQQKYEELLKNLRVLEPYIGDFPQIKKLILKAEKKYTQQLRGEQETTYQTETVRLADLRKDHKYPEAIRTAEKLRVMGIHKNDLKNLLAAIRNEWIDYEIDQNKILFTEKKFEDILLLYQRLLKIDPKSIKLKKRIEQTKKAYQEYKVEEKKEFIYKTLEDIRTLYQLKKYEKAFEACEAVLHVDPLNKNAQSFQKRSAKKVKKIIDDEVITQMINDHKKDRKEYKADHKSFIRIWP